ncbi:hypothetical protein DFJ63DRAFT_313644 [Scheffersomyces coipomensis]|uniref:uncharacterized protein n=1 Tax=Scheffersomyces coipomensis TaxID=1788519 RepID=UPI00315C7BDF
MFLTRLINRPLSIGKSNLRLYSTKYIRNEQIYIHKINDYSYNYSFSPKPESIPIGHSQESQSITPTNFIPNSKFIDLLQNTISKNAHNDFTFLMEAGVNANTFMPIYDLREIPKYARIPEMENIFGYIQVDANGRMVPDTYEPNNLYRICNGTAGLTKLSDHLYEKVQQECEK